MNLDNQYGSQLTSCLQVYYETTARDIFRLKEFSRTKRQQIIVGMLLKRNEMKRNEIVGLRTEKTYRALSWCDVEGKEEACLSLSVAMSM